MISAPTAAQASRASAMDSRGSHHGGWCGSNPIPDRVETTAGKDHAVTILSFRFADPELAPAELCEMFRFRDGKCCEIKPFYYDAATFWAAVNAKAAAV
jgi:hypothetical protein